VLGVPVLCNAELELKPDTVNYSQMYGMDLTLTVVKKIFPKQENAKEIIVVS
jgi:hypothetical protein